MYCEVKDPESTEKIQARVRVVSKRFRDEERSQEQEETWGRTGRKCADQEQGRRRTEFQKENKEGEGGENKIILDFNNVILEENGSVPYEREGEREGAWEGGRWKRERDRGRERTKGEFEVWANGRKKQMGLSRFKVAGKQLFT